MAKLGSKPSFNYNLCETITAAKTLTSSDNGKVFYLDSSDGAYTITLPSVSPALHFKFVVQENTPTAAITITGSSAIVNGCVGSGDATTAKVEETGGTAVTNVIIGTGAEKGAWLEFDCDGTSWYFRGAGTPDNWITTS